MRALLAAALLVPSLAFADAGSGVLSSSPVLGQGTAVLGLAPGHVAWYVFTGSPNTISFSLSGACTLWMNEIYDGDGRSYVKAVLYRDDGGEGTTAAGARIGEIVQDQGGLQARTGRHWIEIEDPPIAAFSRITVRCWEDK